MRIFIEYPPTCDVDYIEGQLLACGINGESVLVDDKEIGKNWYRTDIADWYQITE
jgi:hypothetical protein